MTVFSKVFVFLLPCLMFFACSKGDTNKDNQEGQTTELSNKEPIKVKKEAWKPIRRMSEADNPIEEKIFQWQDSIHRATYEDRIEIEYMEEAIKAMKEHGIAYPKHAASSKYLLRAADYAQGLRNFDEALEIYEIVLKDYQGTYDYADALYFKAYLYDRQKEDFSKAKSLYTKFLKDHPQHDLAPQVAAHLIRVEARLAEKK